MIRAPRRAATALGGGALATLLALGAASVLAPEDAAPGRATARPAETTAAPARARVLALDAVAAARPAPALARASGSPGAPARSRSSAAGESAAPSTGTLTGRFVDDRGGTILRPELVVRRGTDKRVLSAGQLGLEAGDRFRVDLPAGTWSLVARATDHDDSPAAVVVVPPGGAASAPPLVLARRGVLRGTFLLSSRWQAQLPRDFEVVIEVAPDAPPSLEALDDEVPAQVRREPLRVERSGAFELAGCAPGRYRLRLEAADAGWASAWAQTWVDAGDVRSGLVLPVQDDAPASLQGRVLDALGRPVMGATVAAGPCLAVSGPRGDFTLRGLDLGPHDLVVLGPDLDGACLALEYVGELMQLDVQLPPASGS